MTPYDPGELRARRDDARTVRRRRRRIIAAALAGLAAVAIVATLALGSSTTPTPVPAAAPAIATHVAPATAPPTHRSTPADNEHPLEVAAIRRASDDNDYVVRGLPRHKLVALTFDDGPGPSTPGILKWLKAHDVPATFFVIGENARAAPNVVRAEVAAGDAVGDHTESHANLSQLGAAAQKGEIADGAQAVSAITHSTVRLFRPPYGAFDTQTLALLRDDHLLMVLWSVDTSDYSEPGVDRIVFTALSGARAGSIVTMHDGGGDRMETLAALPRIVHRLRLKGYRLVTVPQLLVGDPAPPGQPPPHSLSGGG